MSRSSYMVIERFKSGDPVPVYRRLRDRGRLLPDGMAYVSSWVDTRLKVCYQVMEADDRRILDAWTAAWSDIVDFEIIEVISSAEARNRLADRL